MSAVILNGREISSEIRAELKAKIESLKKRYTTGACGYSCRE